MGQPAQRKDDLNNLGAAIAGVTDYKVKVNGKLLSTDGSSVQDHLPVDGVNTHTNVSTACLLYTSPSPRDRSLSRMPSSA